MRFGMKTLDDLEVRGKTVLLRVDISEPLDPETREPLDSTRIRKVAPTIRELAEKGARVVVMGHQGSDIDYENYASTAPHAKVLTIMLDQEVHFVDAVCSTTARAAITAMADGDVVLLDNVRFMAEEMTLFERHLHLSHEEQAKTLVVRKLAPLADCFVCDAFSSAHRSQPTLCGFPQLLPSAMGRLFELEYSALTNLMERPERPCVFALGGNKVGYALQMIRTALEGEIADQLLVGGLVAQVMLWAAGYDIGEPSRKLIRARGGEHLLETARELMDVHHRKIVLPTDYGYVKDGRRREAMLHALPEGELVSDIGSGTAELFRKIILGAKTVFVNGPMGIFEHAEAAVGTRAVWEALRDTGGYTIIGGEDSIAATHRFGMMEDINHISTGDGALICFLSGEELPAVRALRHGATVRNVRDE